MEPRTRTKTTKYQEWLDDMNEEAMITSRTIDTTNNTQDTEYTMVSRKDKRKKSRENYDKYKNEANNDQSSTQPHVDDNLCNTLMSNKRYCMQTQPCSYHTKINPCKPSDSLKKRGWGRTGPKRLCMHHVKNSGLQHNRLPEKEKCTPLTLFELIFGCNWKTICKLTNDANKGKEGWKDLTIADWKLWLCCYLILGLCKQPSIKSHYNTDSKSLLETKKEHAFIDKLYFNEAVRSTLSQDKFTMMCSSIKIGTEEEEKGPDDKEGEVVKQLEFGIYTEIQNNILKLYVPFGRIAMDEIIIDFSGRCAFSSIFQTI